MVQGVSSSSSNGCDAAKRAPVRESAQSMHTNMNSIESNRCLKRETKENNSRSRLSKRRQDRDVPTQLKTLSGRDMSTREPRRQRSLRKAIGRAAGTVGDVFKRKEVRISKRNNEVFRIETLNDLRNEGLISTLWFTDEEVSEIKRDSEQTASAIDAGHKDVDGRGLEGITEEGAWESYKARKDSRNIVLDEQDRQKRKRIKQLDQEVMAKLLSDFSEKYVKEAIVRAQEDEAATLEFLRETKKTFVQWRKIYEEDHLLEQIPMVHTSDFLDDDFKLHWSLNHSGTNMVSEDETPENRKAKVFGQRISLRRRTHSDRKERKEKKKHKKGSFRGRRKESSELTTKSVKMPAVREQRRRLSDAV